MRPDHHRDTDDAHTEGTGEPDGAITASPRTTPRSSASVRVEHIDTQPMTHDEYRLAVIVLAALINQWKHPHDNPPETEEKAA